MNNLDELVAEFETAKNSPELVDTLMPLLDQVEPLIEKYNELSRLSTARTRTLRTPELRTMEMRATEKAEEAEFNTVSQYKRQIELDMDAIERGFDGYLIKK